MAEIATPNSGAQIGSLPAATRMARSPATPSPMANRARENPSESINPTSASESASMNTATRTPATIVTRPSTVNRTVAAPNVTEPRRPSVRNRHLAHPITAIVTPTATRAPFAVLRPTPSPLSSP